MFDCAVLVVLYNCKPVDSVTIQSLLDSRPAGMKTKFIFWNNGPTRQHFDFNEASGLDVELAETIQNESLAKIYNQFINKVQSKLYVILDHDSSVSSNYIAAINTVSEGQCAFPIIWNENKATGPLVNGSIVNKPRPLAFSDTLLAIGSGVIIGCDIVQAIQDSYGNVFDERFYLYGIDSTFCYRLERLKLSTSCKIIPGFQHSLSRLEDESTKVTDFRRKERSYSFGLTLRHYKKLSYLRVFFILLCKRILNKSPLSITHIVKALVSGRHYRDTK